MNKQDIKSILMSIRNGKNDAIVNGVLGTIDQMNEEHLQKLVAQKGQTPNDIMAYFAAKIQRQVEIQEAQRIQGEEKEREELDADREQDEDQNQDLFVLNKSGKNPKLLTTEELNRDLADRQRTINEKRFRLLEALEKVKDAMKQEKGMLEIDLDLLKDLNPEQLRRQLTFFKAIGAEAMVVGRDGETIENSGREISSETITLEDIEQGTVAFAIPFDKLQSPTWKANINQYKAGLKRTLEGKGITIDEEEPTTVKGIDDQENARDANGSQDKKLDNNEGPDDR